MNLSSLGNSELTFSYTAEGVTRLSHKGTNQSKQNTMNTNTIYVTVTIDSITYGALVNTVTGQVDSAAPDSIHDLLREKAQSRLTEEA
jgi:hypothetical protein